MDKLINLSIKNKSLTFFAVFIIMALGITSFAHLPQNEDPPIHPRVVQIVTFWQGANPEDIELYISKTLENTVSKQDNVTKITSQSLPGVSVIVVEISEYANSDQVTTAFQQIRNYINDARGQLPRDAMPPVINDRFGETSAYVLGLVSRSEKHSYRELESLVERIKEKIKTIEGVGDFDIYGDQPEKIYIEGSTSAVTQMGITPDDVMEAIHNRNAQVPQAYLNLADKRIQLEVTGPYKTLDQIRDTIIFTDPQGKAVRLRDLDVEVIAGYEDPPTKIVRTGGMKSIVIAFGMKRGYHIVRWGEKINEALEEIRNDLPGDLELVTLSNQPLGVEEAVNGFMSNFYQAIFLVLVFIGIGMGLRNALVVAVAVPLIMAGTFAIMSLAGIELHQMSINALIIALGMVVDNAVVIVDNYTRYLNMGLSRDEAAFRGSTEVKIALFSGTLTTIAAFGPLALMPGDVGEYIVDLPRVITIALILSYLVAMFVSPSAASLFIKLKQKKEKAGKNKNPEDKTENITNDKSVAKPGQEAPKKTGEKSGKAKEKPGGLARIYYGMVDLILKFKLLVLAGVILLFAGSLYVAANYIPLSFFPPADKSQFVLNVWLPEGWDLTGTSRITEQLEGRLKELKDVEAAEKKSPLLFWSPPKKLPLVESYVSYLGAGGPRFFIAIAPEADQTRYAQVMVNTSSPYHTELAIEEMEKFVDEHITGAQVDVIRLDTGPAVAAPIQVRIAGAEVETLKEVGAGIEELLINTPGVTGTNNSYGYDSYKLVLRVNQDKAAMLGINSEDIASSIYISFEGYPITQLKAPERQIEVLLRVSDRERRDVEGLKSLRFASRSTGKSHRLDEFATVELATQNSTIIRLNERRTLTVNAYVKGRLPSEVLADARPKIEAYELPEGYDISYGGQEESSNQAFGDLGLLAVMALMVLLLILSFQFKSIPIALAVYLTIPLAFIGAVAGMFIMNQPLGFMSALGLISLAGVVVNNAIVMIEFINDNLREGKELYQSIKEAGIVRLRPILLTTISTLGGLLPLALFGGSLFAPMCWVIIFGLSFSTLLTLFVVPLFFVVLGGAKDSMRIIADEKSYAESHK